MGDPWDKSFQSVQSPAASPSLQRGLLSLDRCVLASQGLTCLASSSRCPPGALLRSSISCSSASLKSPRERAFVTAATAPTESAESPRLRPRSVRRRSWLRPGLGREALGSAQPTRTFGSCRTTWRPLSRRHRNRTGIGNRSRAEYQRRFQYNSPASSFEPHATTSPLPAPAWAPLRWTDSSSRERSSIGER